MLLEPLLHAAENSPAKIAVVDPKRELSYRQLVNLADVMGRIVARQTSRPHVGIALPSSAAFAGAFFGVLWAGKVAVPINFLLTPTELTPILEEAGIELILTCEALAGSLRALPARILPLERLGLRRRMLLGRFRRRRHLPSARPDEVAVILYTSGTDGEPKGVCLTHGNLRSDSEACIVHARMDSQQSLLGMLPMFHSFGLTTTLLVPVVLGATAVYLPRFQPAEAVRTIARHRISILMAIPSMYNAMLRVRDAPPDALRSVILAVSGGEPLPLRVYEAFADRFGVRLLEGYGLTEAGPVVSMNTPEAHRIGTVGRALPGVQVRVVDHSGADVPAGERGELLIRGPNVMQGYYRKPQATASVLDEDGWLRTADLGAIDRDGFIAIHGRKREMIIVGGENVFPREIEHVLEAHPAVAEAAVIGVTDGTRGEVPVAFVIPQADKQPTGLELREFCRDRLAGYKVPRYVHVAAELPRGPTGKIRKRDLPQLLRGALLPT